MREALAAHAEDNSISSSMTGSTGSKKAGPQIFIVSAFSTLTLNKPVLPVPIQSLFPHMVLQLGLEMGSSQCPAISAIIDTAASLTTGRSAYFFEIARKFPHCVAAVYTQKTYSPITLSGIIKNGAEAITSELPVGFAFHMPYKTKDGADSQFVVACGPDVAVNCIIGLPFIKGTKMVFDAADQVAECRKLDCPPFDVEYKRTMATTPSVDTNTAAHIAKYEDFITELNWLECQVADVCATSAAVQTPNSGTATKLSADCLPPKSSAVIKRPDGNPPDFQDVGTVSNNQENSETDDYHDVYEDIITDIE